MCAHFVAQYHAIDCQSLMKRREKILSHEKPSQHLHRGRKPDSCVCKNESVTSATMRTRMQYKCSQKKALNLFHQLRKHQSRHNCWLHSLRASPFLFYHRMRWLNASALFCSSHLTIIPGLKIKPSFIYYNFICIIISRCSVCFCSFS